ncbi:MAG: MFS transporter [Prochlorococcus sp.]
MSSFLYLRAHQRGIFLAASGISTAGSFAGLTAKGWILMDGTSNPILLATHFAALSLPALLVSGAAGVSTDRFGCERVLVKAQWALLGAASLGALAIPLMEGTALVITLLISTLLVGVASAFELTARNKYCALLVDEPNQLAPYLSSFSVVFNVGKLIGPPIGGWLLALTGPTAALSIDAASYLFPIISIIWLLNPNLEQEERSVAGKQATLIHAWRDGGSTLRQVLCFTAMFCLVGFFHPGLAPLIADQVLGSDPRDLGLFTSVLASGSIVGGLLLQRNSHRFCRRPFLTLSGFALITGVAQLGMAQDLSKAFSLVMTLLIGVGTAGLLTSSNLIAQVGSPQVLRGRMAALSQIAFLGGGGFSGIIAALMVMAAGLPSTFATAGGIGIGIAIWGLWRKGKTVLEEFRSA